MGFYATETPCLPRPAAGCERPRETYLPPKNRVGGFSATSPHRARLFASQPLETHWENEPTPTTTASGVSFYGYRFCHPELGRWINRDPIGDISFISRYLQQRPPREHNRLNRAGLKQSYLFVDNTSLNGCDPVGLDNLTGGQNDPPAQICKIPCGGRYIDPLSQGCCNEQPFQLATECCAGAFVGDKVPFYEAAGYSNPDDCVGDFLAGTSPWVPALGGLIGLIPPAGIIGGIGGAVFVGGLYAICNAPFCMAREAGKGPISDPISGPRL